MSGVLVVSEHRRGQVLAVTHELIAAAIQLGAAGAGGVTVLVVGSEATALAASCGAEGVAEVVAVPTQNREFEAHAVQAAVATAVEELGPNVVLCGHTPDSMGFAPALAAAAGLGFAANVIEVGWGDDGLTAARGVYGDRLVARLAFDRPSPVLMVRPGVFDAAPAAPSPVRDLAPLELAVQAQHRGFREAEEGDVDITDSEFLLSIGRGIEDEENIERFSELADRLGATLSASRPLVDAGWVPSSRQVGQSGRTVKPKVYLALGISGAVQHLAGIRDAETVIAVNTDPDAPIFGAADFGAVIDLFELADELERRA